MYLPVIVVSRVSGECRDIQKKCNQKKMQLLLPTRSLTGSARREAGLTRPVWAIGGLFRYPTF